MRYSSSKILLMLVLSFVVNNLLGCNSLNQSTEGDRSLNPLPATSGEPYNYIIHCNNQVQTAKNPCDYSEICKPHDMVDARDQAVTARGSSEPFTKVTFYALCGPGLRQPRTLKQIQELTSTPEWF